MLTNSQWQIRLAEKEARIDRLERRIAELECAHEQISGSLTWKLANRIRGVARRVAPPNSRRRTALKRAIRAMRRAPGLQGKFRVWTPTPTQGSQFRDLPWVYRGDRALPATSGNRFQVLLVGHSACRTGAPHCLLRLAEELQAFPALDCWVVLKEGGELVDSFAKVAPTLELKQLEERGIAAANDAPALVAAAFRQFAEEGMALCNTMAVSDFHPALADVGVPILSWIHELPSAIQIFGGANVMRYIDAASRQVIVPANVVKNALVDRHGFDPGSVETFHYGLVAKSWGLDRAAARRRILDELQIPENSRLVLGCGTVDQRKGADLFVQVARGVLSGESESDTNSNGGPIHFIWVGHCKDVLLKTWLEHDIQATSQTDRIHFVGIRSDPMDFFLASDLFLLTSREDPCPFAMLEAMEAGLPVLAFAGSGGAEEVVPGSGVCVPYLDLEAMATTALDLLNDAGKRHMLGQHGQETIRTRFTWPRFLARFRELLESRYQYQPEPARHTPTVSVIVPNYRHARYLETRLQSIFQQTLLPQEILVLDDASPDHSLEVIERLAAESPVPLKIVRNQQNSGSTFKQWIKGLEQVTGELVWIAESDDCAHPDFLRRLVPRFQDPGVKLAYCQSRLMGPDDERLADDFLDHTNDLSPTRWRAPYVVSGVEDVERGLAIKNTIPNASAVLFRRAGLREHAQELLKSQFKFAGDWYLYARHIQGGKVAYVPESLNGFRRHPQGVTQNAVRGELHAAETLLVRALIAEMYPVSAETIARSLTQAMFEHEFLGAMYRLDHAPLTTNSSLTPTFDRLRQRFAEQAGQGLPPATDEPVLLVLDQLEDSERMHLDPGMAEANRLAQERLVFLCLARPNHQQGKRPAKLSGRVVLLEGTPNLMPWSASSSEPATGNRPDMRTRILRELIVFHRIHAVSAHTPLAAEFVQNLCRGWEYPLRPLESGRNAQLIPHPAEMVHHGTRVRGSVVESRNDHAGSRL